MAGTPNTTLYINNLNDKVNKDELRHQLFSLFMTYGKVLDVVAQKGPKRRGQAFLVFADLAEATAAMRACEGFIFYDKPMHIQYAKTKSYATLRKEDPDFVPPNPVAPQLKQRIDIPLSGAEKRSRDDDDATEARNNKRERMGADDEDEMEMDEEEESARRGQSSAQQVQQQRSARLLCTNLPQEVTDEVLSVLFQQYQGFLSTHVVQSPTPSASGTKTKMAQVIYETPELASVAKEALDGFSLKKGWKMTVTYT